jgi:hypothetical protein
MTSAERKAKNEAIFREANEGIRRAQESLDLADGPLPFICECDVPECRQILRVPPETYEWTRQLGNRFLVAAGHEGDSSTVVAQKDGYVVIEKHGVEGAVAEAENPRAAES